MARYQKWGKGKAAAAEHANAGRETTQNPTISRENQREISRTHTPDESAFLLLSEKNKDIGSKPKNKKKNMRTHNDGADEQSEHERESSLRAPKARHGTRF